MTVLVQSAPVQPINSIDVIKKINNIMSSIDKRMMIHEFINGSEEEMGNYVEFVFEKRTEMNPPKIIGAKISKYFE